MEEQHVEGAANKVVGKVKDAVGGMAGDAKTQLEGKMEQGKGMMQSAAGDLADQVKDSPLLALAIASAVGFLIGRLSR